MTWGFPCGSAGKESTCKLGRSPGEGKGYSTPDFWPGEFHGLYSPWGHKKSDTTERLSLNTIYMLLYTCEQAPFQEHVRKSNKSSLMSEWKSLSRVWLFATSQTCPWNSPGQNTGVGNLSLLQRIFPTQGSNRGLLHCRRILYQLSHQGNPVYSTGNYIQYSVINHDGERICLTESFCCIVEINSIVNQLYFSELFKNLFKKESAW